MKFSWWKYKKALGLAGHKGAVPKIFSGVNGAHKETACPVSCHTPAQPFSPGSHLLATKKFQPSLACASDLCPLRQDFLSPAMDMAAGQAICIRPTLRLKFKLEPATQVPATRPGADTCPRGTLSFFLGEKVPSLPGPLLSVESDAHGRKPCVHLMTSEMCF